MMMRFLAFLLRYFNRHGTGRAAGADHAAPNAVLPVLRQAPSDSFEDATATRRASIYVHSFGSAQLGSLLEGTGAGCVWFDYNNDGLPDLYVVNGRPLDDSMHPYPLKVKPDPLPHNHLYRNDGNGHFTDVTEQAGLITGYVRDRRDRSRL